MSLTIEPKSRVDGTGEKEFFKGVPKIKYEGQGSDNPFAYRWYDENKMVGGKTMKEYLRFACDESLKRLKLDFIDVYQLHNPSLDLIHRGEVTGELEKLKEKGKIRFIGISVHTEEEALRSFMLDLAKKAGMNELPMIEETPTPA